MIRHWQYDDGLPQYMAVIDQWTDAREPCWQCHWQPSVGEDPVKWWLDDNCLGPYDTTFRFNSGDPYVQIRIYREEDAIAFKLRWG